MDTRAKDVEVVIVGAGPTGLTLANILGLHGIRTMIVERNAATVSEPRAVSIDDESLRTMQYIDLIDTVRSRTIQGYGSHYFSASGSCFAKVMPETLEYGFPRRSAFRQPVLEAQLREALKRYPNVEARFSSKVTRIVDEGDSVQIQIEAAGGAIDQVRAQYVAACDGGRSPIRDSLGIKLNGSTYDERWLIVDLMNSTDRFRHTRVFCDPSRPGLALPGPEGTRRYEFMMLPGEKEEELLDEVTVRRLLAVHSEEDARLPIVRKVIYRFHARIADKWRAGRIFLAGDAAHLTPPFAGQGMNSGVRDAQNLGWKLAHVLQGNLGAGALDAYEAERRPHAWALIQMAVKMGHVMVPRSKTQASLTQMAFRLLGLYRPARDYVMQMKYKPQPHYEEGMVVGEAGKEVRGRMFPQPLVERRDGSKILLDQVLGKGFAVLEWDDGETPFAAQGEHLLRTHCVRIIPKDHRFTANDADTEQVRDLTGAIGSIFEEADIRGVILRPDRYVAAALARQSTGEEADRLLATMVRLSNERTQASSQPQLLTLAAI
jgi:3-(3-hydroxy-phenyl)propionate hydroxylase